MAEDLARRQNWEWEGARRDVWLAATRSEAPSFLLPFWVPNDNGVPRRAEAKDSLNLMVSSEAVPEATGGIGDV